jgi:hypothetical protein
MAVLVAFQKTDTCDCCGSREHGAKRWYRLCHAGLEDSVERSKGVYDFDSGHAVECGGFSDDDYARATGWVQVGRAWLCPDHANRARVGDALAGLVVLSGGRNQSGAAQ